jgi:hypothetical protein
MDNQQLLNTQSEEKKNNMNIDVAILNSNGKYKELF